MDYLNSCFFTQENFQSCGTEKMANPSPCEVQFCAEISVVTLTNLDIRSVVLSV